MSKSHEKVGKEGVTVLVTPTMGLIEHEKTLDKIAQKFHEEKKDTSDLTDDNSPSTSLKSNAFNYQ